MNYGPLIFLAAFLGMAGSWFGFVLIPKAQLGSLLPTNTLVQTTYPLDRPGLARMGLEVYRANGCAYCHSQQAFQTGTVLQAVIGDPGTNQAAALQAVQTVRPDLSVAQAEQVLTTVPSPVYEGSDRGAANRILATLTGAGLQAGLTIRPVGPDIERGWATRRSVAEDFLFDATPMPGAQRIGPDLANVGARLPDPNWHLRHLYHPRTEVTGSIMPAYPYLFELRRIGRVPSQNALTLPAPYAAPPGYEVVPRRDAFALVAYLQSLRADAPLFSAPLATASAKTSPVSETDTNAVGNSTTATNAPAQ